MVCLLGPLLLLVALLNEAFTAGVTPASPCPPQWLLFRKRCFAFYPVWTSWSTANFLCFQSGSSLVSLHTQEESQLVQQLVNTTAAVPVWLGGYQSQTGSWFWSDDSPFMVNDLTNQRREEAEEGRACMGMEPKSGELHSAPCRELRFYICSINANSRYRVTYGNRKHIRSDIVPGVSLFDVMWRYSSNLADDVLQLSCLLRRLKAGTLPEKRYRSFVQQEALFLHRVGSSLEVLISRLQESDDDVKSLLVDKLKHYSSRYRRLLPPFSPLWLQFSLQSFHSVVTEEPIYWLVALSARSSLREFLARELVLDENRVDFVYRDWSQDSLTEVAWTHRFKKVIEKHQSKMATFKAINIFREHMMHQKSFYKAVDCNTEAEG